MSKFLKNLKGLFIASDQDLINADKGSDSRKPDPKEAVVDDTSKTVKSDESTEVIEDWQNQSLEEVKDGQVDDKFLNVLLKTMTDNNQEGYDYLEFKKALRSLDQMDMDASTQFKSAYAMAQSMGVDADALLSSGQKYLDILTREQEHFLTTVQKQRRTRIDKLKQSILQNENEIKEHKKNIEQIKEEIAKKESTNKKAAKKLSVEAKKIDVVEKNFKVSFQYLTGQIKEDLQQIKKVLQ